MRLKQVKLCTVCSVKRIQGFEYTSYYIILNHHNLRNSLWFSSKL